MCTITLEKMLPYYEKQGAMLKDVPHEVVAALVQKCVARVLECKTSPQEGNGRPATVSAPRAGRREANRILNFFRYLVSVLTIFLKVVQVMSMR